MDGKMTMNREADYAALEKEQRRTRKMMRAGVISAFCGGGGLAIWLLQRIFSGLTGSESVNGIIDSISLMLMGYTAVIFVTFVVRRAWVLKADAIMKYAVMPGIVLKLFLDFNQ